MLFLFGNDLYCYVVIESTSSIDRSVHLEMGIPAPRKYCHDNNVAMTTSLCHAICY